jgi:hypothetical protein
LGSLEGREADELDRLSEFVEILDSLLYFLQAAADGVRVQDDLEDRVTYRALVEDYNGGLAIALPYCAKRVCSR